MKQYAIISLAVLLCGGCAATERLKKCFKREAEPLVVQLPTDSDSIPDMRDSLAVLNGQLQSLKDTNRQLRRQLNECNGQLQTLRKELSDSMFNFLEKNPHNEAFYVRALMESPLLMRYSAEYIEHTLQLADALGYSRKEHPQHDFYLLYNGLLQGYNTYTNELVEIIDNLLISFEVGGIDQEVERRRFEDKLSRTAYMNARGKDARYGYNKHIAYLDMQIENLRLCFSNKSWFEKKYFEDIRKFLIGDKR